MPKYSDPVLETIKENITLTAVDTYTEISLTLLEEVGKMSKDNKKKKILFIYGIMLEPVSGDNYPFDAAGVTDGDSWDFQITSNSEAAMVETIDKDLIFKYGEVLDLLTSGRNVRPKCIYIWFPKPIPYIKKQMFIGATSDGLAAALDVNFTIFHTYGFISTYQLNRMIAQKI